MDWRFNTIWLDQIESKNQFVCNYNSDIRPTSDFEKVEYAKLIHFNNKTRSINSLPHSDKLLYLRMDSSNIKDLTGISRFKNIKRLELHNCDSLESDTNISSLKDTLEFLHINQLQKYTPSSELFELKKLKVLCLNSCAPIDNLSFLNNFPKLIDFRFVLTPIIDGDLTPILDHPSLRVAHFLDTHYYNYSTEKMKLKLKLKTSRKYKKYVYKDNYQTYRYDYE